MDDDEFSRIKRHHGERAGRPILYAFGFYATAAIGWWGGNSEG